MIQDGHEAFLWICVDSLSTVNSESDLKLLGCPLLCAVGCHRLIRFWCNTWYSLLTLRQPQQVVVVRGQWSNVKH